MGTQTPFSDFMINEIAPRLNEVGHALGLIKGNATYSTLSLAEKKLPKLEMFNSLSGIPQLFYYWYNYREIRQSVEFQALDKLYCKSAQCHRAHQDHTSFINQFTAYYKKPDIQMALNQATGGKFEKALNQIKGQLNNLTDQDATIKKELIQAFHDTILIDITEAKKACTKGTTLHQGKQAILEEVIQQMSPPKPDFAQLLKDLPDSGTLEDYDRVIPSPTTSVASFDDDFKLQVGGPQKQYFSILKPIKVVCGMFFKSYDLVLMRELTDSINKHYEKLADLCKDATQTLSQSEVILNNAKLSLGEKVRAFIKSIFDGLWAQVAPVVETPTPADAPVIGIFGNIEVPSFAAGAQAAFRAAAQNLHVNTSAPVLRWFNIPDSTQDKPEEVLPLDPFEKPKR